MNIGGVINDTLHCRLTTDYEECCCTVLMLPDTDTYCYYTSGPRGVCLYVSQSDPCFIFIFTSSCNSSCHAPLPLSSSTRTSPHLHEMKRHPTTRGEDQTGKFLFKHPLDASLSLSSFTRLDPISLPSLRFSVVLCNVFVVHITAPPHQQLL